MRSARGLVAVLLATGVVGVGCTGQSEGGWGPLAPTRFVAADAFRRPEGIVTVDAKTGRTRNLALHLAKMSGRLDPNAPEIVTGLALDSGGDLWVTRSTGPVCTSNVADCGPKPNSCVGQIERVDHRTGDSKVIYKATPAERIDGVSPSPSVRDVAFLVAPCDQNFFNDHIRVQHLGGTAFDIGAGVLRCHFLSVPAWVSNGTQLAAVFHPPALPASVRDAGPGCPPTEQGGVVTLPVAPAVELPSAAKVDETCRPMLLTATNDRVAVLSSCAAAPGEFLNGPAQLLLTDSSLHSRSVWPIRSCVNDASLAVDRAGDIAMSSYELCGQPEDQPHTLVFVGRESPHQIADVKGGTLALNQLAW